MTEELTTLIRSAISRNELDETKVLLDKVPLEKMSQEISDSWLQNLLIVAHRSNSLDVANFLLDEFDKLQPNDEKVLTSFTRLFTFPTFPDDSLKWLINSLDNESYIFIIDELVRYDSAEELLPTFVRITDLFNIKDPNIFRDCLELAKNEDNSNGVWFFSDKLIGTSEYAQDASYVKNYLEKVPIYKELVIPEVKFQDLTLPSLDEVINLLTGGLQSTGANDEQIQKLRGALRNQLEQKTDIEIFDLVKPILLNVQHFLLGEDEKLFRIMGPVNPSYGSDLSFEHICYSIGGGHRMFYCTCYEIDVEDEPREEWFTGCCQFCLKSIKNRAHAIRRPLATGGFRGCYCSAQCVKNSLLEVDVLVNLMLDEMLKMLRKLGIQDRTEDPDDILPKPNTEARVPSYSEDY